MDDYRSRLIDETRELRERLGKLREFIHSGRIRNLNRKDQELLRQQEKAMTEYHTILETRLARG